jgi:cytoplasmic iron level regulating protein YaaA (DUF328/UPF0246 family)
MGNILILISCSGKKKTETEEFKAQNFINSISENKEKFLEKRKEIKKLIQTYKVEDRELREGNRGVIGENIELIDGPDFAGNIEEKRYLPAYKRYKGRFFIQLNEEDWEKAKEKGYHILIISGLYGLISFEDSIQDYNCHLTDVITGGTGDQGTLVDYWIDTLTDGLKEYIKNNNIDMIIDLISEESYQHSIKWEEIEEDKELRILHRVFEKEAGPGSSFFLTNLGRFFKNDIINKSPEEVRKIKVSKPGDLHLIERNYFKGNDRIIFESKLYELGFSYVARESDRNIELRLSSTFGLGNYWGSLNEFEKYYIIDGERVYLDFKSGKLKTGIPCIHSFWTATESVRKRVLEKLFELFYDWGYREVIIPDPKSSVKSVKLKKEGRKLKFFPGVGAFETELLMSDCENPEKIPLNLRDKLKPTVEFVRKLIRDLSIFSLFRKDGVIYTQRELRNKLKGGLTNPEEIKEKVEKFHDLFFDKGKSILIAYLRLIEELKKGR